VLVWRAWGEGPPVLLAHGSHGSWSHWIRNLDALAAQRTVWAPDLPGYGESAMPPDQNHAAYCEILADGMRRVIVPEFPIDVVGFSFGGAMAAYLAIFHPDLVRRVIVVGSGGLDTPVGPVEMVRVRGLRGEERRAALRAVLLGLMLHNAASADDLAVHLQSINGPRGRLNPTPLVLPDKLSAALPRLPVQLDAIWGEHDRPHPPADQEEVLRRYDPHIDFRIIADAGHWAMYERPEDFNRTVLELLDRPLRQSSRTAR
jgi:pimeloyl-ACP methyl ester carboxylesterase